MFNSSTPTKKYNRNEKKGFTTSLRSKNLFLLNTNKAGPGYYFHSEENSINKVPIIIQNSSTHLLGQFRSQQKINPGPGEYDISTSLKSTGGKLYLLPHIKNYKIQITPGPGSYSPKSATKLKISCTFGRKKSFSLHNANTDKIKKKYNTLKDESKNNNSSSIHLKKYGFSFGAEERHFYDKTKIFDIGPGCYDVKENLITKNINFGSAPRFKTPYYNDKFPGPGSYNTNFDNISSTFELKQKINKIKKAKRIKYYGNYKSNDFSINNFNEKDNYHNILRDNALKKIEGKIKKKEEKEKIENKKKNFNLGFTLLERKNEFLILQTLIKSPGPIYNIRSKISNKNAVIISKEKKKSIFKGTEGPGPGSYDIQSGFSAKKKKKLKEFYGEWKKLNS